MRAEHILPYRKPWILTDVIEECIKELEIVSFKAISTSDYFIKGHFETYSVYPGVLLVEGIKQTSELFLREKLKQKQGRILQIEARFLSSVLPGDMVKYVVRYDAEHQDSYRFLAYGEVRGGVVVKTSMIFEKETLQKGN